MRLASTALHCSALLLFLLGSPATAQPESPADATPSFLVVLIDDLRHDVLGCAGHPIVKTPEIDALAADGVRFRRAFVTTSICAASRASILTGLHERTHGYTFGTPPISATHARESYPAVLRRAGYRTGFIGKFGVRVESGLRSEMFDEFHEIGRNPYFKPQPDGSRRHETDLAADRAIEFLRAQPHDRPFCLSVSFNAVHAEDGDKKDHFPWPPSADGLYDDIEMPRPRLDDPAVFEAQPEFLKQSLNRERYFWRWDTPEKYTRNLRAYFRMITGVDHAIGRLRAGLREVGRDQDTVLIVLADNGYYMGERGFAGKWSHYDESLRIPLIVHDPRRVREDRGASRDEMVLNLDVAPTLLDLAGLESPRRYAGRSLKALLRHDARPLWRHELFCEHRMEHAQLPKWEGVRGEHHMYAHYFEQEPPVELLYDLRSDPDQLVDLAAQPTSAELLLRMRRRTAELSERYRSDRD